MRLEDQVCSLDLSKKLKELGVKQESYVYWYPVPANRTFFFRYELPKVESWSLRISNPVGVSGQNMFDPEMEQKNLAFARDVENERVSAFTVAELGEMLPPASAWNSGPFFHSDKFSYGTEVWYFCECLTSKRDNYTDRTEANARAKCLIYLIENGIVKV